MTLRLTAWYAGLFGALSVLAFLAVYVSVTTDLSRRTDAELLSTGREFEALYRENGLQAMQGEFDREAASCGVGRVCFRLFSSGGRLVAASDLGAWKGLPGEPAAGFSRSMREPCIATHSIPDRRHKVRSLTMPFSDGYLLCIDRTLRDNEQVMERYRETFGTALTAMILVGGIVGWLLARKAMAGVRRVSRTASGIGEASLDRRVPLRNEGQEINELAESFNQMLGRIQVLVTDLGAITEDLAHDLRSPLTRIRGLAETTLTGEQALPPYRDLAVAVVEECDWLVGMLNTMLEIARTDAATATLPREPLDLVEVARGAAELFEPASEDKHIRLTTHLPPNPLVALADRTRMQRVITNLLDNAVKFTPAGGTITISARRDGAQARIDVADNGPGIEAADLPRIFDRFFRAEKSRSTPGSGLGLSLARAIVRAYGGEVTVTSSLGRGSVFTVLLPASPTSDLS